MKERIINKLVKKFNPQFIKVTNNSHLHKGHIGDNNSGESHFKIEIEAQELKKTSLIQSHRLINQLFKEEFENGLHALEIKIVK